jgi:RNA polymerase sigma-70 factor, ECF subfamily
METISIEQQKYSDFDSEIIPHLNSLKNYALRMTNDYDDSEDLLQDTLLKAFRFFDNYGKGTNARAWLFKIMRNAFINDYRSKARQPFVSGYDEMQNAYETIECKDAKKQEYRMNEFDNILDDEIVNALSDLPEDFRTIIFLCDIEGYSYQEISDFVNCPIGTVRSRLHRTRKILYNQLFKYAKKTGYVREEKDSHNNSDLIEAPNIPIHKIYETVDNIIGENVPELQLCEA